MTTEACMNPIKAVPWLVRQVFFGKEAFLFKKN
jgi:hypothetical protein